MLNTTKLLILAGLLCAFPDRSSVGGDEEKGLLVGDVVTEFKCLDEQGQVWNSRDFIGKKIVVVYFYPSDFSFCCTRQAVRYRDHMRDWCECGVEVVGISGDAVTAHRQFKETHQLHCALLSDAEGTIARQFGVPLRVGGKAMIAGVNIPRAVTAARWTFIIGKDGRVIHRETEVSPVKDSQEVLDFIRTFNP